jgi:hypothetical protein
MSKGLVNLTFAYLSILTGIICRWMIRNHCRGGVVTYGGRLLLHFDVDCNGGRHFDHANSGEWYSCLVCGNHVPWRHDPLAQCCRILLCMQASVNWSEVARA